MLEYNRLNKELIKIKDDLHKTENKSEDDINEKNKKINELEKIKKELNYKNNEIIEIKSELIDKKYYY